MENYNLTDRSTEQLSPEKLLFNEAVEKIEMNERAVKLLILMENGFLLDRRELNLVNVISIVGKLRAKYPIINDIQTGLTQTVEDQIGVVYEEGWTSEQYEQACRKKQSQYKIVAKKIIDALDPVYEECGAVSSEDSKNRIWDNINGIVDMRPNEISDEQKEYLIKNISEIAKQKLDADEARSIMQVEKYYLKDVFIESELRSQVESAVKKIEKNSGVSLELEKQFVGQENIENLTSKKELDISDFRKYIEDNYQKIERELQQGRELDDIFYRDFYSASTGDLKYMESDPEVQELKRRYAISIKMAWEKFENRGEGKQDVLVLAANPYWTYCYVNQGVDDRDNIGRFYLNLDPEYVGDVLVEALELFQENGLHVEMKVPTEGSAFSFNRHDKMVIYFGAEEEKEAMRVIETLYSSNDKAFSETGVPRFAAEVKNSDNKKMTGVGFGEEPDSVNAGASFGQIRVEILSCVYQDAKYCGLSINDPGFDFYSSFEIYCKKFQVDPKDPAFNFSDDQEKFATIKK